MESKNGSVGERTISNEIAVLKARMVSIQDRFIAALNGGTAEDDRTDVADGLSWALSSESILSSLRVEIMLDTEKDHANALNLVSMLRLQIEKTEEALNRIEDA